MGGQGNNVKVKTKMLKLTIKRTLKFVPARNKGVISLLKILGVPKETIGQYRVGGIKLGGSFWQRNEGRLEYLLHDIKEYYLKTIKEFHPDKSGGNLENSKIINSAWREIKKRFNNRLNPKLYIRGN